MRGLQSVLFALALTIPLAAQSFKAGTDLVTIPLVVTNRGGSERISGLQASDFRVFEDDVEQTVTLLDQERRPLSLCIVLDSSVSMKGVPQDVARQTVQAALEALAPDDEVSLVVFAQDLQVPIPWTPATVRPRVNWSTYQLVGGTALNDALREALRLLDTAKNSRTAILIVSDGGESSSRTKLSDSVATRRQSEALVYAAEPFDAVAERRRSQAFPGDSLRDGPGKPPPLRPMPSSMSSVSSSLVGDSGGVVYRVSDATVQSTVSSFFDELRYLYTLAYTPTKAPDGKYRRVRVEAQSKNHRVRHRAGYLAMPVRSVP